MKGICELCGKEGKLHVHHKDGIHLNDVSANRASLCPRCHKHQHSNIGSRPRAERLPYGYRYPSLSMDELKKQYQAAHPRA